MKVFVSATREDLGPAYELIGQGLAAAGCTVVDRGDIPGDYFDGRRQLVEQITKCDAVVHVVSGAYGAEPHPATVPLEQARQSYAQMEAEVARELRKKLHVLVCDDDFPYERNPGEHEEVQALQKTYRERIQLWKSTYTALERPEEILPKVSALPLAPAPRAARVEQRAPRPRRRIVAWLFGLVVVFLAVLFIVGNWSVMLHGLTLSKKFNLPLLPDWRMPAWKLQLPSWLGGGPREPASVAQLQGDFHLDHEGMKKSLTAFVRESADAKKATAAANQAIYVDLQRNLQLLAVDRLVNSIEQAVQRDEASPSYRIAVRLLGERSAAEALAHLEHGRAARAAAIAHARESGADHGAEYRRLLREDLLMAALQEQQFNAEEAERTYRKAVDDGQKWAEPHNALGTFLYNSTQTDSSNEGARRLDDILYLYQSALVEDIRTTAPLDWAATQANIGRVMCAMATIQPPLARIRLLAEAITCYDGALEIYTKESTPQEWADCQNDRGDLVAEMGQLRLGGVGEELFGKAIESYRKSLEVFTREEQPLAWANTITHLAVAQLGLSQAIPGSRGLPLLQESVANLRQAGEVVNRADEPLLWAVVQVSLGSALASRVDESTPDHEAEKLLSEAVPAIRGGIEVESKVPLLAAALPLNQLALSILLIKLSTYQQEPERTALLLESDDFLRQALAGVSQKKQAAIWAAFQGVRVDNLICRQRNTEALSLSEEVLALKDQLPDETLAAVEIARAHALLCNGRYTEAIDLYHKNWNCWTGAKFGNVVIARDLKTFQRVGAYLPMVTRALAELAATPAASPTPGGG